MANDLVQTDVFDKLPERYRVRAREIKRRVAEIDALMIPCQPDAIRDSVVRMRGQLRPQPDVELRELADEFKAACRDLPEWALAEAANDFLAGRVENHTGQYMPTCAEFALRARQAITPFLAERSALRTEASKLIERATDDHRRHQIDIERRDPAVRSRVARLHEAAMTGAPKSQAAPHHGLNAEKQARIDAMKRPQHTPSKIAETRIVLGKPRSFV